MRIMIVGLIVLTLGVAGVSTYLITVFGTEEAIEEQNKRIRAKKVYRVLVAQLDLKTGTVITPVGVAFQDWPENAGNDKFIAVSADYDEAEKLQEAHLDKVVGGLVRRAMNAGEPVIASKVFKRDQPGYMAGMLSPGKSAVTISVNQISGTAGFIFPGDFVDILLTHDKLREVLSKRVPKSRNLPLTVISTATETIMENIRVLAIGQKVDEFDQTVMVVPTVTLELTPKQSQIVITARSMGILSLLLRSLETPEEDETGKKKVETALYTTDVEVSPFLRNFDKIINQLAPKPKSAEKKPKSDAEESGAPSPRFLSPRLRFAAPKSPAAEAAPKKKKKQKKKRVITILRGGSGLTERVVGK